jgi:hypothetical protein
MLIALGAPAWAQPPTVEELRRELERKDRQIKELMERMERLEQRVGAPPAAPPAVAAPAAPSPAPPPAEAPKSPLKVSIGGYVKLDLQYADRDLGGSNLNLGPGSTPLGPTSGEAGQQGRFSLDARETRINVEASGEVQGVTLTGRVQVDFYGNEDSALTNTGRVVRLREAFARGDVPLSKGRAWYLLAGQTTSTFSNSDIAAPDTVDANGPAGILGARQPQLRLGYQAPVGPEAKMVFEVGAQQHSFSNVTTGNSGTTPRTATDGQGQDLPLFVGKVQWLNTLLQLETAGALSRNKGVFDKAGDRGPVATRRETAWGVQVSGQITPWEPLTLYAHYQHLDGLNREGNGDFHDVVSEAPGGGVFRLRNIESDGWYTGMSVKPWGDTTLNVIYGQNRADEDVAGGFTRGTTIQRHRSVHLNVMRKFWTQWKWGLEYQRFMVDSFGPDRREGSVNFYHGGLWFFY